MTLCEGAIYALNQQPVSPIVECYYNLGGMFVGFKEIPRYFHFQEIIKMSMTCSEASRQESLLFITQRKDYTSPNTSEDPRK